MTLVNKIFSDLAVNTIGWTLVHSLWQGALIALLFLLLLVLFRKSRANIRYLIGVSMLFLMILASMVTLNLVYQGEAVRQASGGRFLSGGTGLMAGHDFWFQVKDWFDRGLPLIVSIWFLGALFFFLRFVSGILGNQRLRHHHLREVSEHWQEKVRSLAQRIRVRRPVVMRESFLARFPLTIGHLKPMILFPVGMLAQIPPSQVETLIVHELAHILRRDYIVNVFQNIMEILYFYHPGIRWVSNQIRNEREHCCDDLTVSALGDRLTYAMALTRVGENAVRASTDLALAASGNSFKLLKRIRRLLPMTHNRSRFVDGMVSFIVMAVFAVFLIAGISASGELFATAKGEPAATSDVKNKENKEEAIQKLQKRYQELATRKSDLSENEKKELTAIAGKLEILHEKEADKKIAFVKAELRKLKEKKKLTGSEKEKYEKYSQFLMEYEKNQKIRYLKEVYEKLKLKGEKLSEEEKGKLRAIEEKLKLQEVEEKVRQEELMAKEEALHARLQEYKAREAELSKEEKARLKETALKLKEIQARAEELRHARKEKAMALKSEYLRLQKMEERTLEQEEKLKKLQHYMQELKARYHELSEKRGALEKAIQAFESKSKLSKEETHKLQSMKKMLEKVQQEISGY